MKTISKCDTTWELFKQTPQRTGHCSLDEGGEQHGDGGGGEDGGDRVADAEQSLLLVIRPPRPRQPAARPALQLHQQRPEQHGEVRHANTLRRDWYLLFTLHEFCWCFWQGF